MMITTAAEAMTAVETKVFKENSNASIFELAFFFAPDSGKALQNRGKPRSFGFC